MLQQDLAVNIRTAQDLWAVQPRAAIGVLFQTLQVHLRDSAPEADPADPWALVQKIARERNDIELEAAYSYVKGFAFDLARDIERDAEDWELCVTIAEAFIQKLERHCGNQS